MFVEEAEWNFIADLFEQAYRLTAPKSQVERLDD
jgi:hypothetical protein